MRIGFEGKQPDVHDSAYIAPNAVLAGDVVIGRDSSVWFGAVLRGDEARILVGERSNIQDNATVHCDRGIPAVIGNDVTIGHNAVIHSCAVGDGTVVGMGAVILTGASIGSCCVIAAGAVVKQGCVIPDGMLAAGIPAEIKKALPGSAAAANIANAEEYVRLAEKYSGKR